MKPAIDVVIARRALGLVARAGGPVEAVLAAAGLQRDEVAAADAKITIPQHLAVITTAAKLLDDPCFGLRVAAEMQPRDLGLVGYVGFNAANLGMALAHMASLTPLFSEASQVAIAPGAEEVRIVYQPLDPAMAASHHIHDFAMAGAVRLCRLLTNTMLAPLRVDLRHANEAGREEYARVLRSPVWFRQPATALTLSSAMLKLPVVSADPNLFRILIAYAEEQLGRRATELDLVTRVEHELIKLLPYGSVSLAAVGRNLGMSARTLSRRLSEEDTTFGDLLDRLRFELAKRYLTGSQQNATTIANLLGYAEVSAFNHAFRRGSGTSPQAYRREGPAAVGGGVGHRL